MGARRNNVVPLASTPGGGVSPVSVPLPGGAGVSWDSGSSFGSSGGPEVVDFGCGFGWWDCRWVVELF